MTFEEWWGTDSDNQIGFTVGKLAWNAAQLAEREACAKVCEYLQEVSWGENPEYGSWGEFNDAAVAIRSRSD